MILPRSSIRYKLSQRTPSLPYFVSVKTNMQKKGRRSDSSQFIPTRWRKKHSPASYFRASDIFKNITGDYEHCMFKFQSAWKKSLPGVCAPKAKLPTLNYWFQAKVSSIFENTEQMKKSVQLTLIYFNSRKAEQYFSQEGSPRTQHYINFRVSDDSMRIC